MTHQHQAEALTRFLQAGGQGLSQDGLSDQLVPYIDRGMYHALETTKIPICLHLFFADNKIFFDLGLV